MNSFGKIFTSVTFLVLAAISLVSVDVATQETGSSRSYDEITRLNQSLSFKEVDGDGPLPGDIPPIMEATTRPFQDTASDMQDFEQSNDARLTYLGRPAQDSITFTYTGSALWRNPQDMVLHGQYLYAAFPYGLGIFDVTNPVEPVPVSQFFNPVPSGIAISGEALFLATLDSGLAIFDVSEPSNPERVALLEISIFNEIRDVAVVNDYVYLACAGGLWTVDVSDLHNPFVASFYIMSTPAWEVFTRDDYIFVSDEDGLLQLFDITNPSQPDHVGTFDTPGWPIHMATSGDYAYVADYDSGLSILDVSIPGSPSLVKTHPIPGYAVTVEIAGDYAYLSYLEFWNQTVASNVILFDISDPTNPLQVGSFQTAANYIVLAEDYAYTTGGAAGLSVVDITDPSGIHLLGSFETSLYSISDIHLSSNLAYVAGERGMEIVDISSPQAMCSVGTYWSGRSERDVAVSGDYAYLCRLQDQQLAIVDLTDATNPTFLDSVNLPGRPVAQAIVSNQLFVLTIDAGLLSFDISNGDDPQFLGSVSTKGIINLDLDVSSTHAFASAVDTSSDEYGLQIIEFSDAANPKVVGSTFADSLQIVQIATANGRVYGVSSQSGRIGIFDASDVTSPFLRSYEDLGLDDARDIAVAGDLAYVCGDDFRVIDVADPNIPLDVANHASGGSAVFLIDSLAAVAHQDNLMLLDVSNTGGPTTVANWHNPTPAWELVVADGLAFIIAWDDAGVINRSLLIFDIGDASAPTHVATYVPPTTINAIAVQNNYAYLAGTNGLIVVDVSIPCAPAQVATLATSSGLWNIAVNGDLACATGSATAGDTLRIFDISDATAPSQISSLWVPGGAGPLVVVDTLAYVSGSDHEVLPYEGALTVINIANPSSPQIIGSWSTGIENSWPRDLVVEGDYVYMTVIPNHVFILDVSTPSSPTFVGGLVSMSGVRDLSLSGNWVLVGNDYGDLFVVDVLDPESPYVVAHLIKPGAGNQIAVNDRFVYMSDQLGFTIFEMGTGDPGHTLKCVVTPDTMSVIDANSFPPTSASILLGNISDGLSVDQLDGSSIRINTSVVPDSYSILPSHPEFEGEVMKLVFPVRPFIRSYGPIYNTSSRDYIVTGQFGNRAQFAGRGTVVLLGHRCGDVDLSGSLPIDIADLIYLVDYMFRGGPNPQIVELADVNGSSSLDIADIIYVVDFLFNSGPKPACE